MISLKIEYFEIYLSISLESWIFTTNTPCQASLKCSNRRVFFYIPLTIQSYSQIYVPKNGENAQITFLLLATSENNEWGFKEQTLSYTKKFPSLRKQNCF